MITIRLACAIALVCFLFPGCRPTVVSEHNVAKFDYVVVEADSPYSITMAQLYAHIHRSGLLPNGGILDTVRVRAFLDSVVCDTLTGIAALDIDLKEHNNLYRLYLRRHHDFVIKAFLEETIYSRIHVDSLEVVDFYYSRPDLFSVPEQVHIYHILTTAGGLLHGPDSLKYRSMSEEALLEKTAKYAQMVRGLIDSHESFEDVARQYSHDTLSGRFGGLVGWIRPLTYMDPFDSVAFAMREGDISEPYRDTQGWHILYCDGYLADGVPPLDSSRYISAERSFLNLKANEFGRGIMDSLFGDIDLECNESILDSNIFLLDRWQWLAVVGGADTIFVEDAKSAELAAREDNQIDNTTAEMKREMLKDVARRYVVVQAARSIGIDTLPDIVANERGLYHKYAKSIINKARYAVDWKPSDSLIEQYYRAHVDEFTVKKPLVVQQIISRDSVFGEFLRDQALSGVDFLELAAEYYPGDETVRVDLADLGEIGQEDVPDPFWQAALRVPVGEISHPVKTEYGYHIIKVLERRQPLRLAEAKRVIEPILKREHRNDVFNRHRDELYARFRVRFPGELYPTHLKPVKLRRKQI